ncbi:hypothetical protein D4L85_00790 [Chryseolinea soli]|uniref:Prepilin type IV endopeptidase peptidase domain-containing protein n=2 Tax=Chryseolinea soli TaxID=2321403 RepID=A0A385SFV3_9BACT|nr:hypothetical protein D4L85_00790 [Chryseolinea soli]
MSAAIIVTLCILGFIFYQDLRFREISLIVFPLLFVAIVNLSLHMYSMEEILINGLMNALYVAFILGIGYLYFSFRRHNFKWSQAIGLGDLIFLGCIISLFDFPHFVVFMVVALIASLLLHVLMNRLFAFYRVHQTIPLAGYLSLCVAFRSIVLFIN